MFEIAWYIDFFSEKWNVPKEDIRIDTPAGGMTNRNVILRTPQSEYILRIPGEGTEEFIDRRREKLNTTLAVRMGWHPEVIFFDADSGVKVSQYLASAETMTNEAITSEKTLRSIATILKQLHGSREKLAGSFSFETEWKRYDTLIANKAKLFERYPAYEAMTANISRLTARMDACGRAAVPCHNDLVSANWLMEGERIFLIDWEYAGMNDPAWDIASLFCECEFSGEDKKRFFSFYLSDEESIELWQEKVDLYEVAVHLVWFAWTAVKEQYGVFWGEYGEERLIKAVAGFEQGNKKYDW